MTADALLRDAFGPIARAGADTVRLQIRLQKAWRDWPKQDPEMAGPRGLSLGRALDSRRCDWFWTRTACGSRALRFCPKRRLSATGLRRGSAQ